VPRQAAQRRQPGSPFGPDVAGSSSALSDGAAAVTVSSRGATGRPGFVTPTTSALSLAGRFSAPVGG